MNANSGSDKSKRSWVWLAVIAVFSLAAIGACFLIDDPAQAFVMAQEVLKLTIGVDAALLGLILAGAAIAAALRDASKKDEGFNKIISNSLWACSCWFGHLCVSLITFVFTYSRFATVPRIVFLAYAFPYAAIFFAAGVVTLDSIRAILESAKIDIKPPQIFFGLLGSSRMGRD